MKQILLTVLLILVGFLARAELKRIYVDLDYKMIKGSNSSNRYSSEDNKKYKNIKVFMPDLNDQINVKETSVICQTHTGSRLTVSPKEQSAHINTNSGEVLNYLIVQARDTHREQNEIESIYALDDGRKIVMTFPSGSTDGQGFYVRRGGSKSPSFPCSKN